jgi:hypothetical protein
MEEEVRSYLGRIYFDVDLRIYCYIIGRGMPSRYVQGSYRLACNKSPELLAT